jgi:acetyl/propionyl-CoA carboxylase alpha subunit
MPGVIEKISVEPGAEVQKGDPLVTMIAMKMEVSRNIHVMFLSVNGD